MFFFQAEDGIRDLTVTGVQTCALPISLPFHRQRQSAGSSGRFETLFPGSRGSAFRGAYAPGSRTSRNPKNLDHHGTERLPQLSSRDRKSTRLNSSHSQISYAVFCLKKKKHNN